MIPLKAHYRGALERTVFSKPYCWHPLNQPPSNQPFGARSPTPSPAPQGTQQRSMLAQPHAAPKEPACLALFKADFGAKPRAGPAATVCQPSCGAGPGWTHGQVSHCQHQLFPVLLLARAVVGCLHSSLVVHITSPSTS